MKVFFSHAREDKAVVEQVFHRVVTTYPDVKGWLDRFEIVGGDDLIEKLAAGIDEAGKFLIFISERSVNKPWVRAELRKALLAEIEGVKPAFIVPVKLGAVSKFPPFIESKYYIDLETKTGPFRSYDELAARSSTAPPQTQGLYAWWQSAGALPGVHGTPHPEDSGFELLYVGTAPKDATSKNNLRKRLGNHHRAAIGSSTFRLDLTAFLWQVQGWRPGWTDRPKLPDDDIAALAEWQRKHLHVQWVEVPKPWNAEKAVVHAMHPPLNHDHNQYHPAYARVGDARDSLRGAARRNPL